MDDQIKSKQRVVDHGEVLTREQEVNAMLDLVKHETERIDSRFLEPACGTGNFLSEILRRKLQIVASRYSKDQLDYERHAVLAISSIYGIDILFDNVQECRERLFQIFDEKYTGQFRERAKDKCRNSVKFILSRNIIHGDALSLETVEEKPQPITFSEWSLVNGSYIKRRDFRFDGLLEHEHMTSAGSLFSDLGDDVFIPIPSDEHPLMHFLEVANDSRQ